MKLIRTTMLVVFMLAFSALTFAQTYTVSGKVIADATGEGLIGANVYMKGANIGAATDVDGKYEMKVPAGEYTLVCSYIGYETKSVAVNVDKDMEVNFAMADYQFSLNITVISDRAKERETPVAFSDIDKEQMEFTLGSRDIPLVLNSTPSVYSTMQGGGAGDARINIRGFDQRNVAIMINGIPVNDMENGWVYWSNWDGVGDATSSIQVQRGLSAINLATPSVGGVMNVITDPTAQEFGVRYKQEYGSGSFWKSTLTASSGMINDKLAFNMAVVRKIGDGVIDKTWTDAWAYYFGAAYNINKNHRLELYALGAPQRHGQNLYKQNIGAYSHEFAKDLDDYDPAALNDYAESPSGRKYNENWNWVREEYKTRQFFNGSLHDRYSDNFINERENYYHKPVVNLNWFAKFSDRFSLYSTIYYSGGQGGGSGTYGSLVWDYSGPSRIVDWNRTFERNRTNDDGSRGILRNSVNNQWTYGAMSRGYFKVNKQLTVGLGVDWRTAEIDHYREVRDLLGGNYYVDNSNQWDTFDYEKRKKLGDKIAYHNTNTVDWLGVFGQGEYTTDKVTLYGMAGWTMIKYRLTDHFKKNEDGAVIQLESDNIHGFQVKGGASYRFTNAISAYANFGYVSKVPIFDQVIDDEESVMADSPENEKFISFEAGLDFRNLLNGMVDVKTNFYFTNWNDRANNVYINNPNAEDDILFVTGMDVRHMGFELEYQIRPHKMFWVNGAFSFGDWVHTSDVSATYKSFDEDAGQYVSNSYNLYVNDLKVGDAPQMQNFFQVNVKPSPCLTLAVVWKYYGKHYASWDPLGRNDATDRTQSWEAPAYHLFDVHASYDVPVKRYDIQIWGHVFNLFDTEYISDATDNSAYNGFDGDHDADDAEVYLGLPMMFNVGVTLGL